MYTLCLYITDSLYRKLLRYYIQITLIEAPARIDFFFDDQFSNVVHNVEDITSTDSPGLMLCTLKLGIDN